MAILTQTDDIRRVLLSARVVAVLGASDDPSRPAYYVPDYLHDHGFRIRPVNPLKHGTRLWGATFVSSLSDVGEPIDILDVFRRSDQLAMHVDEILALAPMPKVVWFQSGIRDSAVAKRLATAGIDVVQDRCMLQDHRRMFGHSA